MRLDKKDVARLLEGVPAPDMVGPWLAAESYRILDGLIYADNPQPNFSKDHSFADPDLFFSFAQLGVRGEPSEKSILRWVSKHGLLKRANEKDGALLIDTRVKSFEVNQAPITVERFRAEVLCAYQLLTLYTDVRENVGALEARIYGTDGTKHPSSYWPHTPSTDLEDFFASHRDVVGIVRRGLRFQVREGTRLKVERFPFEVSEESIVKHWDVWVALRALQHIVENRIANVRLSFDENYLNFPPLGGDYRIPRSWDCPDLLSAMYLQFYLLITDVEPLRRCKNPACDMPFPATRKNKRFCNATCRSNARHYR